MGLQYESRWYDINVWGAFIHLDMVLVCLSAELYEHYIIIIAGC